MTQIRELKELEIVRVVCDREYRISHELYTHFPCDNLDYYFTKKEHTHFRNY